MRRGEGWARARIGTRGPGAGAPAADGDGDARDDDDDDDDDGWWTRERIGNDRVVVVARS